MTQQREHEEIKAIEKATEAAREGQEELPIERYIKNILPYATNNTITDATLKVHSAVKRIKAKGSEFTAPAVNLTGADFTAPVKYQEQQDKCSLTL